MKFLEAIFRDPLFWLAAFFVLLPSVFQFYWGIEGRVVAASPLMRDAVFEQVVLYMADHSVDGATGVVINRPYTGTILPKSLSHFAGPVFWGGPVQDDAVVLVLYLPDGRSPVLETLAAWQTKTPDILKQAELHPSVYRVMVGYCAWQALQFERERLAKAWVVEGISRSKVFRALSGRDAASGDAAGDLWRQTLEESGFYKRPFFSRRAGA